MSAINDQIMSELLLDVYKLAYERGRCCGAQFMMDTSTEDRYWENKRKKDDMERESLRRSHQLELQLRTEFPLIVEAGVDSEGATHLRCQVRGAIHAGTASSAKLALKDIPRGASPKRSLDEATESPEAKRRVRLGVIGTTSSASPLRLIRGVGRG